MAAAREAGAGVLVLVRTSNPGAADIEDLTLEGGGTVWERLAAIVERLGAAGVGRGGPQRRRARSSGATAPGHLRAGPRADGAARPSCSPAWARRAAAWRISPPAFAPGRAGGLVTASRSIADAHRRRGAEPAAAARAEAERLREAAWTLSERADGARAQLTAASR